MISLAAALTVVGESKIPPKAPAAIAATRIKTICRFFTKASLKGTANFQAGLFLRKSF
jgi:hypothetical protein